MKVKYKYTLFSIKLFVILIILSFINSISTIVINNKRHSKKLSFFDSISNIKSINNSSSIINNKRHTKKCIDQWYESLNNNDLNTSLWLKNYGTIDIEDVFIYFTSRLANLFDNNDHKCSSIYYLQIGACDGSDGSDYFFELPYKKYNNIKGLFVEPLNVNINDLYKNMIKLDVLNKSLIIEAAATNYCIENTIKFGKPMYNPKDELIDHWKRRQIGSLNTFHKNYIFDKVNCTTPADIIQNWKIMLNIHKMRIHLLKIDTEGHDFIILNSFFKYIIEEKKRYMLPLLLFFEYKIKPEEYMKTEKTLDKLGYICSDKHLPGYSSIIYDNIMCMLTKPRPKS